MFQCRTERGGTDMIDVVKSQDRHYSDHGWLKTYWLFSFSSYFDPHNIQFGALRVFNDDVVEPGTGFPTHPHEEMEIITIVLDLPGPVCTAAFLRSTLVRAIGLEEQTPSCRVGARH
jgi:hypothetical protein